MKDYKNKSFSSENELFTIILGMSIRNINGVSLDIKQLNDFWTFRSVVLRSDDLQVYAFIVN